MTGSGSGTGSNTTSRSTTPTRLRLGLFGRRESEYSEEMMTGARTMLEFELEDMSIANNPSDVDRSPSKSIDALSLSLSSKSESESETAKLPFQILW